MNILIVDDDDVARFVCRRTLLQFFKVDQVHDAANGFEALEIIRTFTSGADLDFILLDLHMPGMDGFQLIEAIRSTSQYADDFIPIAMITSSIDPCDVEKAVTLGVTHLTKPVSFEKLSALLPMDWHKSVSEQL